MWLDQRPAAVQCVLFQTGDLQVEYHSGKSIKTTAPTGNLDCTVMFHLYRDEVPGDLWEAFDGIAAFLRILGFNSTSHLRQVWSVAFFERNRKCSQDKATYLHGFLKAPDSKHLELLRLSGLKGFYCSSRSSERSVDGRYKVIWLEGARRNEVELSQYLAVRKHLLPGAPVSPDSENGGDMKFRLLRVPRSTDRSAFKRVLVDLGWPAKIGLRDFNAGLLHRQVLPHVVSS